MLLDVRRPHDMAELRAIESVPWYRGGQDIPARPGGGCGGCRSTKHEHERETRICLSGGFLEATAAKVENMLRQAAETT